MASKAKANRLAREEIRRYVRNITVNNGDILAIKVGSVLAKKENTDALSLGLARAGKTGSVIVVVESFTDLAMLDETEMNRLGWRRMVNDEESRQ